MSTYKGYGLVRDKNGVPRVDDPSSLHPVQVMMLTPEERKALGLWAGAFVADAQGFKRVRRVSGGYEAVDKIVAASVVIDENGQFRLPHRIDVPIGGAFKT
jgi:hypothetical protein